MPISKPVRWFAALTLGPLALLCIWAATRPPPAVQARSSDAPSLAAVTPHRAAPRPPEPPAEKEEDTPAYIEQLVRVGEEVPATEQGAAMLLKAATTKPLTYEQIAARPAAYIGRPWVVRGRLLSVDSYRDPQGRGTLVMAHLATKDADEVAVFAKLPGGFKPGEEVIAQGYLGGTTPFTYESGIERQILVLAARFIFRVGSR